VRLTQVIGNILNNAAKFTRPGDQIWLTVTCEAGQAVISIRDTGIGIEPEVLPRIFQMFSQADGLKHTHGGLGIGLALAKQLVEMHGGQIEGRSQGRGFGSEFVIRLPLAERQLPVAAAVSPTPERLPRSARRVLIVDDNHDAANSLGTLLKMLGNEIQTANDGLTALELLQWFRPNVVLLDLGMPGMTGYDVARRARELSHCKDTVFVALTGWGQEEDRRKTREAGFNHHLLKPVNLGALEVLLSEAPERREN
jgi:CheY-like chemotaxis protein